MKRLEKTNEKSKIFKDGHRDGLTHGHMDKGDYWEDMVHGTVRMVFQSVSLIMLNNLKHDQLFVKLQVKVLEQWLSRKTGDKAAKWCLFTNRW